MEKIAEQLRKIIKTRFEIDTMPLITISADEHGDFSTNVAMQIAGEVGKSPRAVAEEIINGLADNFSRDIKLEVAGPGFINFTLVARDLHSQLVAGWSSGYGDNKDGEGKTAVVEYPSPNIAKPYSVGHLRSGNQGWAARNLMLASGWKVITDNHIGDYGAPFGIWVTGFRKFSSDEQLKNGGVYELGRVYITMKAELAKEKERGEDELAKEVQGWLLKLEEGDAEARSYFDRFNEISLAHIHEIMARLGISTEYEMGETFFVQPGKKAVNDLLVKGIAEKNDDDSVIVRLDDFGIKTPLLVQKSNGAALYATTDLATLLWRNENWHPDKAIYSVGAEQKFYFEQLVALAQKIGIKYEIFHLWFGTIDQIGEDGKREKMSSRKGVILMEELLDEAEKRARQNAKGEDISDDDIRKIALGAIKFTDFSKDRRTNSLFDWDSMFSLTGFSGPYVQYAAVRINKILKDNPTNGETKDYDFEPERDVIKKLLEYPDVIRKATDTVEPHRVALYAYELARIMNRYYEKTPVATDSVDMNTKIARLSLLEKIGQVFEHSLAILGIEIPGKM